MRAAARHGSEIPRPATEPPRNMARAFPEMFLFRAEDENDERREEAHVLTETEARLARDLREAGLL